MATEAQRAPRVVRDQTSMADAAAAQKAHLEALHSFKFNGTTPFSSTPIDLTLDCLREAHSLSLALSSIMDVPDGEQSLRSIHAAGVASAIGTLLALAAFAIEGQLA